VLVLDSRAHNQIGRHARPPNAPCRCKWQFCSSFVSHRISERYAHSLKNPPADILADIMLIVIPVRLFLNSQLEVGTKTRLVIIFSASILTTVVSLVHAYYILKVGGPDVLIAALVEVSLYFPFTAKLAINRIPLGFNIPHRVQSGRPCHHMHSRLRPEERQYRRQRG
jgi:hypothetical protein